MRVFVFHHLHTIADRIQQGKSVVSRREAFARVQDTCDARSEGKDIFVLSQADSLILGWDDALTRAKEFKRIGVDAVFVEALPDREAIKKCVEVLEMPVFANSKPHLPIDLHSKLTNTSH